VAAPAFAVLICFEKPINDGSNGSLGAAFPGGREGADLFGSWREANQVERQSPEYFPGFRVSRWLQFYLFEFRQNKAVDL
jgi:hypothetical protein